MKYFTSKKKGNSTMAEFNLLNTITQRNKIYFYNLNSVTAKKYITDKMKYGSYKINVEVENHEVDDEGVRMRYILVTDHDENVKFMTDVKIGLVSWDGVCWDNNEIHYVDYNDYVEKIEKNESMLWQTNYFVYDGKLLLLSGHSNAFICCNLCTLRKNLLEILPQYYKDTLRLSKEDVEHIIKWNKDFF